MLNSTQPSHFTFSAYFYSGHLKYLYFLVVLCLYVVIIGSNVLLIVVICVNRSLHEPMYMFLCSLLVNQLYGSTGLFPFLLIQILSDVHTVSTSCCFLQIFCVFCYANIEFLTLAIMSYDRYLAICRPLQYNMLMTSHKVSRLICLIWLYVFVEVAVMLMMSVSLQLCGNIINKVYCDNYSVVKLACSDTTVNNVYGLTYTLLVVMVFGGLILFTYSKILQVCFSGCKQTRLKALSTCSPHLLSMLNFSCGCFFEVMQGRFNMSHVPNVLRVFLSLYFLVSQPLLNPVMYGLRLSKIRSSCKHFIFGTT